MCAMGPGIQGRTQIQNKPIFPLVADYGYYVLDNIYNLTTFGYSTLIT